MKTPVTVTLAELDIAARLASEAADAEARAAGLSVAGIVRESKSVETAQFPARKRKASPPRQAPAKRTA
jgi:hypothetical protein